MATEAQLREVKRRHSLRLLQIPGVSGVGIEKDDAGEYVLAIHVNPQDPPAAEDFPLTLDGHPVKVVRSGPFKRL